MEDVLGVVALLDDEDGLIVPEELDVPVLGRVVGVVVGVLVDWAAQTEVAPSSPAMRAVAVQADRKRMQVFFMRHAV